MGWKCWTPVVLPVHHDPIPELRDLTVCYWDKDRHSLTDYHYTITDAWEDELRTHIAKLDRYKADGVALPPRLPTGSWQCNWCPYSNRCWQTDSEGVEL